MAPREFFSAFFERATAGGSRSTALQPLAWLIGILTAGVVTAAAWGNPPAWLLAALLAFDGVAVAVFLGVYIHFARKSPDALRSEKFTLTKMAIEKNLIGDDKAGLIEVPDLPLTTTATTTLSPALPNPVQPQ